MEKNCKQCWKDFETEKWYKLWRVCSTKCKSKYNIKYRYYNCVVCWDKCKVQHRPDKLIWGDNWTKLCKKEECKLINRRKNDNNYTERIIMKHEAIRSTWENTDHDMNTFFLGKESLYADKIIDYDLSPSGKWYIGLNKQPLIPNDNWIWYKWVLMQSTNRTLVQCSECWKWYKVITNNHLKWHWLTKETYNEKYWLNKTQSLVSDTYSRFYASHIVDVVNKRWVVTEEQRNQWIQKWRETMAKRKGMSYNTDQMKNNNGTCDLQLKHRFINYLIGHHKYPPMNKYSYWALRDRFWSINNALQVYWLPTRKRLWYTTLFEFNDWYSFKVVKWKGYEELFDIMKLKCAVLTS